jgi:hypothetical protein
MDVTGAIQREYDRTISMFAGNPAKARQAWADAHALFPASDLTPEERANKDDSWNKDAANAEFLGYVAKAGQDIGALRGLLNRVNAENGFPGSASAQRERWAIGLQGTLQQQQEQAADRALRQREMRNAEAKAVFDQFTVQSDQGTGLNPRYTSAALAGVAGTVWEPLMRAQMEASKENGGLASQPIAVQQALRDRLAHEAAVNGSPAIRDRLNQVDKILRGSKEALTTDGLRAAADRGRIVLTDLDVSSFEALKRTGAERARQTQDASRWAGRQVSPLLPEDARSVAEKVAGLEPKDRATYLGAFAEVFGDRAMAAMSAQIATDPSKLSVAIGAGLARHNSISGRSAAELYFRGRQAITQGQVKADPTPKTGTLALIYKELAGVYRNDASVPVFGVGSALTWP